MHILPTFFHSRSRFQGCSLERARWRWDHLDGRCDWTQVKPLCKRLRVWPGMQRSPPPFTSASFRFHPGDLARFLIIIIPSRTHISKTLCTITIGWCRGCYGAKRPLPKATGRPDTVEAFREKKKLYCRAVKQGDRRQGSTLSPHGRVRWLFKSQGSGARKKKGERGSFQILTCWVLNAQAHARSRLSVSRVCEF